MKKERNGRIGQSLIEVFESLPDPDSAHGKRLLWGLSRGQWLEG